MNPGMLIPRPEHTNPSTLPDMLLMMAFSAEEALQTAGAEPGRDYSYMDLFQLAQPFALSEFERRGREPTSLIPKKPQ